MLIDHKIITDWANKRINELDQSFSSLSKKEVYADIISYTESLSKQTTNEYAVDYTCPLRNSFIESSENSI